MLKRTKIIAASTGHLKNESSSKFMALMQALDNFGQKIPLNPYDRVIKFEFLTPELAVEYFQILDLYWSFPAENFYFDRQDHSATVLGKNGTEFSAPKFEFPYEENGIFKSIPEYIFKINLRILNQYREHPETLKYQELAIYVVEEHQGNKKVFKITKEEKTDISESFNGSIQNFVPGFCFCPCIYGYTAHWL